MGLNGNLNISGKTNSPPNLKKTLNFYAFFNAEYENMRKIDQKWTKRSKPFLERQIGPYFSVSKIYLKIYVKYDFRFRFSFSIFSLILIIV